MAFNREELKKLLKEKGVKSLDDFNAFMREVSKDVVEDMPPIYWTSLSANLC